MGDNAYEATGRLRHGVLALVGGALAISLLALAREPQSFLYTSSSHLLSRTDVRVATGVLALFVGVFAVREAITAVFSGVQKRQGVVTWRNLLAWSLYVALTFVFGQTLGLNLNTLLFGGAIATIVLATLAQAALSGIFAGLVLMLARPYRVGEQIYLRTGQFGGAEYEGIVVDIGAFYTILSSRGELLKVPNTSVITSVLMTRYRPKRADVELDLPARANARDVEDAVRDRLALSPGSRIRLEPLGYSKLDGDARVRFRLQVFADHSIDLHELIRSIDESVGDASVSFQPRAVR